MQCTYLPPGHVASHQPLGQQCNAQLLRNSLLPLSNGLPPRGGRRLQRTDDHSCSRGSALSCYSDLGGAAPSEEALQATDGGNGAARAGQCATQPSVHKQGTRPHKPHGGTVRALPTRGLLVQ